MVNIFMDVKMYFATLLCTNFCVALHFSARTFILYHIFLQCSSLIIAIFFFDWKSCLPMADNVLEPYTFSFGDANPASVRCSSRVWVLPTSILQRKISRCIYVCIACWCYEPPQCASQIWKSFCKSDRPFSSLTWSGRLFFCSGSFRVCNRSKQGELVPTHDFWIWFCKSDFKNDCWASPKPDIQHINCADCVS